MATISKFDYEVILKFQNLNLGIVAIVANISYIKCCRHFWQHYGDPLPPPSQKNVRRRGFTKYWKIFAEMQSLKVGSKIDFSCFLMKFHPKSILRNENKFFTPREGLVRHFGLLLGFTSTRWGSRKKEISEQAHSLSCQVEKSKMQISAKNTENKI